jgi:anaerobic sulfite reductase subunit B
MATAGTATVEVGPMVPARWRVTGNRRDTADTVTLTVEPLDGDMPTIAPGQFHMLYAFGVGEVPISFSGIADDHIEHTIRDVGMVTRALCAMEPGDVLGVRGPYGVGWDLDLPAGRDAIVVAGGIGLAPLRPAIQALLDAPDRGHVAVLVGARSPDLLLYLDDLQAWGDRPNATVEVTVDVASPGWTGRVGLVTELFNLLDLDPANTTALTCGPDVMMRFAAMGLADRGVPGEQIQVSLERNMKCAIGHCGHCQFGPEFVCMDGPVVTLPRVAHLMTTREL